MLKGSSPRARRTNGRYIFNAWVAEMCVLKRVEWAKKALKQRDDPIFPPKRNKNQLTSTLWSGAIGESKTNSLGTLMWPFLYLSI